MILSLPSTKKKKITLLARSSFVYVYKISEILIERVILKPKDRRIHEAKHLRQSKYFGFRAPDHRCV